MAFFKIKTVDSEYVSSGLAACFWVERAGRCFLVETNTSHATARLWAERPSDQVDAVWITHVHLDHAGGVGRLLHDHSSLGVYGHPRAIRHLVDPARLIQSAKGVYGIREFDRLYGEILAVPPERAYAMDPDSVWTWQDTHWWIKHVRGHANHHLLLGCEESGDVFTGDAFGLSYPHWWAAFSSEVQRQNVKLAQALWLPSTSPTDFDAEAAIATVDWIQEQHDSRKIQRVWLTHFGPRTEIVSAAKAMRAWLEFSESLRRSLVPIAAESRESYAFEQLQFFGRERVHKILVDEGLTSSMSAALLAHQWVQDRVTQFDLKINAQGLAWAAARETKPA